MVFRFGIGEPNVANPSQQNGKLGEHRGDAGNMFSYGCDSIMPKSTSLLRGNQPRESAPDDQVPTHILSEEVISLNEGLQGISAGQSASPLDDLAVGKNWRSWGQARNPQNQWNRYDHLASGGHSIHCRFESGECAMTTVVFGGKNLEALEPHPVAAMFDLMDGPKFAEFLESCKDGIDNRGTLYEGKILDGRNRWRAATAFGLSMEFNVLDDSENPFDAADRQNKYRSQRTKTELAMAAVKRKPLEEKWARERQAKTQFSQETQQNDGAGPGTGTGEDEENGDEKGDARDKAGAAYGVSGSTVDRAEKILESGCDELIKLVREEKIGMRAAASFAKKFPDKDKQAEICAEGVEAIRKSMKPPETSPGEPAADTPAAEDTAEPEAADDFELIEPAKKADCESFLKRLRVATPAVYFKFTKDVLEAPEFQVKPVSGMAADRAIMLLAASKPKVQQQAVETMIYELPEAAKKKILATLLDDPSEGIVIQMRKWSMKKFGAAKINVIDKPKSIEEVRAYASQIQAAGERSDAPQHADSFFENYASKGWMVDKNKPVVDWRNRYKHWCRQMGSESAQDRRVDPGIKMPGTDLAERKRLSAESMKKMREQRALEKCRATQLLLI